MKESHATDVIWEVGYLFQHFPPMVLNIISFLKEEVFKGKTLKVKIVKWRRMSKVLYSAHTDSFSILFMITVIKKNLLLSFMFYLGSRKNVQFRTPKVIVESYIPFKYICI